jgi:competence protein ComEA
LLLAWRGHGLSRWSTRPVSIEKSIVPLGPLDLNRASAVELRNVPGLGPALAERIVEQRRRQGEFRRVEDLRRVKGVGVKTLERIRPFLHVEADTGVEPASVSAEAPAASPAGGSKKPTLAEKIDVNRAGEAELRRLPGIGPTLSARIVAARKQRPFATVDELRRVKGIGAKTLERLRPHVTVAAAP